MAAVETVRGSVELDHLGVTLMHEHVFVVTPDVMQNYGDEWWDEEVRVADAIKKLGKLKAAGVDTIVDPTVVGLGRYIPRVARINAEVDINIVAATGLYTFDDIPHFFDYRGRDPGAAGGLRVPPRDRRADHRAHELGAPDRAAGAGDVRAGGRRPDQS